MRTCQSCGKANNPIRKYCTRCGKSLIQVKEEKPAPAPTSVVTETPIPDVQPAADQYVRSDEVKATTNDEWVRPSQVSRDRVRSGSATKPKSEMEKAKEAFARAEGVGIDEADGSGIVETRMLRASEVRELMGDGATITGATPPPTRTVPSATSTPTPAAPAASPTPAPTPPPTPAATPPAAATPTEEPPFQPIEPPSATPAPTVAPTPAANAPEPVATPPPRAATPPPAAAPSIPVKPPTTTPTATAPSSISLDKVPEIEEILSQVTESEDLQDPKIKDLVASLTTLHTELRTVKEDLANVSGRLDEFVRSCQNDAEVKRIHYESLVEQERFAKQEYESAKKEYERVDKRRKKEISNLDGKVKNVEKNISKSKDALKKRIVELDKVREKIAQLQSEG